MNYFELHIGDYEKATAHLTACEDGMYGRLMRRYYDTEEPLPLELKAVQRLVRARTREEKEAVETILDEFFEQGADGWHHKRCDEEIARYREKEPDREAKKENARERQRRARERRVELFDALRGHGIVPAYDTSTTELQAQLSRVQSQPVTPPVTRDVTATQTPDTRHQSFTPDGSQRASGSLSLRASNAEPLTPGQACAALRRGGLPLMGFNASHPDLVAAIAMGATEQQFHDIGAEAAEKAKGFAWAVATLRGRLADAARQPTGAPHGTPRNGHRLSAVERVEANIRAAQQQDRERDQQRRDDDDDAIPGQAVRLPG